jgi:hypothetical protein
MVNEKCKIHDVELKLIEVSVSYGLPFFDEEELESRSNLFPNAKSFVLGGCDIESAPNRSEVLFCDKCREAEKDWKESRRKFETSSQFEI